MAKPENKSRPEKKAGLTPRQKLFFEFLKEHERKKAHFTAADISDAVKWKPDSIRTNLSEGHWNRVLVRDGKDRFRANGVLQLSEREFHSRISQSKHVQSFGHGMRNRLAASLLARSRDNMVLALELYNRPSLANRLDGFVMLYCAAWEQMLKAQLIDRDGEESIFETQKAGQERRSIGLTVAIARVFPEKGPGRKNLEEIQDIRDRAVHLLVPELQSIVVRLFQAGVFNYARHFKQVTGEPFVPHSAIGMLTLVADETTLSAVNLHAAYGVSTGDEVNALMEKLKLAIDDANSWEYAIPLEYRLVFSNKDGAADVVLTKLAHDALDANVIAVVEKPRERKHTHPYLPKAMLHAVQSALRAAMSEEELRSRLGAKGGGELAFTPQDLLAVADKEGWRRANNEFHHCDDEIKRRWYSQRAVDTVVDRIRSDQMYLVRARESYRASMAARKPGGSKKT